MIAGYICDCSVIDNKLQWHTVKRSEVPRSCTTYFYFTICHSHKGNNSLKGAERFVNVTSKNLNRSKLH